MLKRRSLKRRRKKHGRKKPPEGVDDLRAIQEQVNAVWESSRNAIVGVKAHEGEGSGVIVSEDGYVLTAGHVSGEPGRMIELFFEDGSSVTAETLGLASYADSGMAKITEEGKMALRSDGGLRELCTGRLVCGDW